MRNVETTDYTELLIVSDYKLMHALTSEVVVE